MSWRPAIGLVRDNHERGQPVTTSDERPLRPHGEAGVPGRRFDVVVDGGPVVDATELCARLEVELAASGSRVATCDVGAVVAPDAAVLDALARLQLTARRLGARVVLCRVGDALHSLLALTGLDAVLGEAPCESTGPGPSAPT